MNRTMQLKEILLSHSCQFLSVQNHICILCSEHLVQLILLKVIAATVASDPTRYSEAFLGKPNEEYCSWILDSEKWGGLYQYYRCLMETFL